MTRLNEQQIAQVALKAGFTGAGLTWAVAVALAESGGKTEAVLVNHDQWKSRDRGLWQINDHWHPGVSDAQAFSPEGCAQAAYAISGGGTNWRPWSTYVHGLAGAQYGRAAMAVAAIGGQAPDIGLADPGPTNPTDTTTEGDTSMGTSKPLPPIDPNGSMRLRNPNGDIGWGGYPGDQGIFGDPSKGPGIKAGDPIEGPDAGKFGGHSLTWEQLSQMYYHKPWYSLTEAQANQLVWMTGHAKVQGLSDAEKAFGFLVPIEAAFAWLSDGHNWARIGMVLGGSALAIFFLYELGKSGALGVAAGTAAQAPMKAATAAASL